MAKAWSKKEDEALYEMGTDPNYAINRGNNADWDKIAETLNGIFFNDRTAAACQSRFYKLNK